MLATDVRDLIDRLRGEVDNGGFEQYFTNSTADRLDELLTALGVIGADSTARIVRRACEMFPAGVPSRDASERRGQLDQVYRRGMFVAEDRDFYRGEGDLEALVRAYEIAEAATSRGGPGRTPLHYAALEDRVEEVRGLLATGADPDAQDRQGFTPLHFAAQQGAVSSAQLLAAAGAQVNIPDVFGNTPLHKAAFQFQGGDPALIRLLIAAGADPDLRNKTGRSPRDVALLFDRPGVRTAFADAR